MSDDYLWNKDGPPDPEIEALERALAPLAHREGAEAPGLAAPTLAPEPRAPVTVRPRLRAERIWFPAAVAATLLVAWVVGTRWLPNREKPLAWAIEDLSGVPRINGYALRPTDRFAPGQWLVTDARSRARLTVGDIGTVTIEPRSRVRLLRTHADDQRLSLVRGSLHAYIVAPPRQFTVETPAVHAVDLGCAYRLDVAEDGRSTVTVETGWVSFEASGHETFIPAGAMCVTRRGAPPGTPVALSASPEFQRALTAFDDARNDAARRERLSPLLAAADSSDALSLWHLLARPDPVARASVFDRLSALVPPPAGVTRAGVIAGERPMLDAWWNELGYGDVEWWRIWLGRWPAGT